MFRTFATIKKCKRNLKIDVIVLDGHHFGEVNAMLYIMTKKAADTRSINPLPSRHYYEILHSGYERFGFDGKILIEALLEAVRQCNPQS